MVKKVSTPHLELSPGDLVKTNANTSLVRYKNPEIFEQFIKNTGRVLRIEDTALMTITSTDYNSIRIEEGTIIMLISLFQISFQGGVQDYSNEYEGRIHGIAEPETIFNYFIGLYEEKVYLGLGESIVKAVEL